MASFFHVTVPEPVVEEGCIEDADCPSKEACFLGQCHNACLKISPCVENAVCKVYDTLPRRTMTCTCIQGYKGKGDVLCEKISKIVILKFSIFPEI